MYVGPNRPLFGTASLAAPSEVGQWHRIGGNLWLRRCWRWRWRCPGQSTGNQLDLPQQDGKPHTCPDEQLATTDCGFMGSSDSPCPTKVLGPSASHPCPSLSGWGKHRISTGELPIFTLILSMSIHKYSHIYNHIFIYSSVY